MDHDDPSPTAGRLPAAPSSLRLEPAEHAARCPSPWVARRSWSAPATVSASASAPTSGLPLGARGCFSPCAAAPTGSPSVVPYGDPGYQSRTSAPPTSPRTSSWPGTTDGLFRAAPEALAPLLPLWSAGNAPRPPCTPPASPRPNRSHFSAMEQVEEADPGSSARVGWVNRMVGLTALQSCRSRRVDLAVGYAAPSSCPGPVPLMSIGSMASTPPSCPTPRSGDADPAGKADRRSLRTLAMIVRRRARRALAGDPAPAVPPSTIAPGRGRRADDTPANGAVVPRPTTSAARCADHCRWIKRRHRRPAWSPIDYGDLGPCTSTSATSTNGSIASAADQDLAPSLAAFFADLGDQGDRVTLVTTSEFGRRRRARTATGRHRPRLGQRDDGGRRQRRSAATTPAWPGLSQDALEDGDVKVTTDFRQLLADVVQHRVPEVSVAQAFPGLTRATTGVIA